MIKNLITGIIVLLIILVIFISIDASTFAYIGFSICSFIIILVITFQKNKYYGSNNFK